MHQILVIYLWHVEDAQILHHLQQEVLWLEDILLQTKM